MRKRYQYEYLIHFDSEKQKGVLISTTNKKIKSNQIINEIIEDTRKQLGIDDLYIRSFQLLRKKRIG